MSLMIKSVCSQISPNVSGSLFTNAVGPYLLKRNLSSYKNRGCNCHVSIDKINQAIAQRNLPILEVQSQHCKNVQEFKKWDSYAVRRPNSESEEQCKILTILRQRLHRALKNQENIRVLYENPVSLDDLASMDVKENEITFAGEGGAIVGKSDYWASFFDRNKQTPLQIVSIGGGRGYDAKLIARVFKEQGFLQVMKPHVVDPNHLAAYLSNPEDVDFYPIFIQKYLSDFFHKSGSHTIHLFHLGTVLNVVPEVTAVSIIEDVANHMSSEDIISILMVDEEQFKTIITNKQVARIDSDNPAGLARYVYTNGRHYKTVIKDLVKFKAFCKKHGLEGEFSNHSGKSSSSGGSVLFTAYKAKKSP